MWDRASAIALTVISVLCLSSSGVLAAGGFEPKNADVCLPSPHNPALIILDYKKVVHQLVEKTLGISPVDLTGDDVTVTQETEALIDPVSFCVTNSCGINASMSDKDKAAQKKKISDMLGKGWVYFQGFVSRHSIPGDLSKDSIDTSKLVSPDNQQQGQLINQFLHGDPGAPIAACKAAVSSQPSQGDAGKGSKGGGSASNAGQIAPKGYFSLRQTVEDLPIPQSSNDFKGAKSANIQYTDDGVAQKQSFSVTSAAGYTFGPAAIDPTGRYIAQFTPFVLYNEQTVETPKAKNNSNVENIGFGALGDLVSPTGFDYAYQDVKIYPQYVQSLRNGAEVVSGHFVYTPMYGIPAVDNVYYLIPDALSVKLTPELKVVAYDVIEPGTGATALTTGSYYWIGPYLDLKLFGEGALSGLTYDVSYETYDVTSGLIKQISYFQTSLAYNFGTQNLASLKIGYQYGRDLDTLEKLNIISVGFGLKY